MTNKKKCHTQTCSRSPTTPNWHEDPLASPQSILQSRATNSYLDGTDTGSNILDAHSSTALSNTLKSGTAGGNQQSNIMEHQNSLSNITPLNKEDSDSIMGNNEKSELDGPGGIENDAKSISSNKSAGSQQERYLHN